MTTRKQQTPPTPLQRIAAYRKAHGTRKANGRIRPLSLRHMEHQCGIKYSTLCLIVNRKQRIIEKYARALAPMLGLRNDEWHLLVTVKK